MADLEEFLATAKPQPLKGRGLTQATCKKWNYLVRQNPKGEWEQLALYCNNKGELDSVKIRNTGKDGTGKAFSWIKHQGHPGKFLFGRHLWSSGGKALTITEGELDALTVSQLFDHKYPVVSVPNGAAEAASSVAKNLEWINSFDKVVFMFDMDTPGREAATECAKLLPPGKAYIAVLPDKDPNACLVAGNGAAVTNAFWRAEPYRPDGIVDARTLTALCLNPVVTGLPWPWKFLTDWTYGRRRGETYWWGGGTGIGKTDFLSEIIASTISGKTRDGHAEFAPEGCAVFSYETGPVNLKKAIAGKLAHRRFHIPKDPEHPDWTDDEHRAIQEMMDTTIWDAGGKLFLNSSAGAADWEAFKDRARYLVHGENIRHLFVDPVGALVIGEEDHERTALDSLSLEASMLAQELDCSIYLCSHLTRPSVGPSHEEGGQVSLRHFRGSNGIAMFAFFCFGLERDQQAEEPIERTKTIVRSLKDRYTGNSLGKTMTLFYDMTAGTLDTPKENELTL